jgi:hypothetical protein
MAREIDCGAIHPALAVCRVEVTHIGVDVADLGRPDDLELGELPTALPATLIMAANGGASWKSGPLAAPNAAETYQPRSAQLAPKKGSDKSRAVPFRMASSCLPRYALASLAACCAPAARCSGCNCT